MAELEPEGTYRPQFHAKARWISKLLNISPKFKEFLASKIRKFLLKSVDPGLVTTERVIEYPFVFQSLGEQKGLILDLGCCTSRVPIALASRGFNLVGIDFNPYPYKHPNLNFAQSDIMVLPFKNDSFSVVMSVSTLEHVGIGHYGDPEENRGDKTSMKEIFRILKPGGEFIMTAPYGVSRVDHFQRIYDKVTLNALLEPLEVFHREFAWRQNGLWLPCKEEEAASVNSEGGCAAVVLIRARKP